MIGSGFVTFQPAFEGMFHAERPDRFFKAQFQICRVSTPCFPQIGSKFICAATMTI